MLARKSQRALAAAAVAALTLTAVPRLARAGDADDLVLLAGGGRLRGVVLEESPTVVTVKLADGTVRAIQRHRVSRIQYGEAAPAPGYPAPALAVAPPLYPPPVATAPPAPGWRYAPDGENALAAPPPLPAPRRSKGLMITGIVLMPLGALTLGLGATACAISPSCPNPQLGGSDVALMIVGSATLVTGIVFTAVGASRRPLPAAADAAPADLPPRLQLQVATGPRSVSLVGLF
jgi:hypothetical protein